VIASPAATWPTTLKHRLAIVAGLFALWAIGIEVRLVILQIHEHDELAARADRQQRRTVTAPAKRGEIYDRHGRLLAYSVDADSIYAVPTEIGDPGRVAAALCDALDECSPKDRKLLVERLSRPRAFVYVRRRVTPLEAKRVAALDLDGIGFMKESKRYYPNRELAANLLGYVGVDNVGLDGVEAAYDSIVRGRPGTLLIQTDARSHAFSRLERTPTSGSSIELTLDEHLQYIAERELAAGVAANRADGGAVVVMDPQTGEILAMANSPTFNPNVYNASRPEARRNRAVQDLYEPGSTFKIVTASAAFEEKVVSPGDLIDTTGGSIKFPGRKPIFDTHDYGVLTFTDVLVKSSNVGAIKVGLKLGPERLGLYINRFGFGRPVSTEFPGESPGIVWNPARLNDSAVASVSMGYQVAVTPLQMAAAASSVANGGTLNEPRILAAVVHEGVRKPTHPRPLRRTIKPDTAAALTTIMEEVVASGTARRAALAGFTVAGKTGTAAKLVGGRYSTTAYNASFVGFVPSRAPAVTIIVVIDTPRTAAGHQGGAVAAPIFKRIAEATLRYLGVPPTIDAAPPVMVTRREATSVAPTAAARPDPDIVTLTADADSGVLPDFRGQGARDAMRALARLGLTARIVGTGVVTGQDPPPGSPLEPGATCTLLLGRQPSARTSSTGAVP
jgi:cell division protein FtsI (penicillin-binding protein 3)